jgi:glycosyltransferase involved in cell wall biosynthesis
LNKPTVDVLLASFNGDKYLEEQLDSLDRQEDVNVRVWVNDDGSVDETLKILEKWQEKGLVKSISTTERIGSTRVFLRMLSEHLDSKYVAFCDQDDIWEPRKLVTQVLKIESEEAIAVISQRLYIDSKGAFIGKSKKLRSQPSFENAMIENIAFGNTIVVNNEAIKLINSIPNPQVEHYDSWIYLLVSMFGKIVEVPQPLTQYRIHSSNLVGLRKMSLKSVRVSVNNFVNQNIYLGENISKENEYKKFQRLGLFKSLRQETNLISRYRILQRIGFKRQRFVDQVIMKLLLLFVKNTN